MRRFSRLRPIVVVVQGETVIPATGLLHDRLFPAAAGHNLSQTSTSIFALGQNHGRNHDIETPKDRGNRNSTQILQEDRARESYQGFENSRPRQMLS